MNRTKGLDELVQKTMDKMAPKERVDAYRQSVLQRYIQNIEKCCAKHPELRNLEIRTLEELSYQEISSFVETNWYRYYGNQTRIVYSPQRLQNDCGEKRGVCIRDGKSLLALALSFFGSCSGSWCVSSAHTVDHLHQNRGIGRLLHVVQLLNNIDRDMLLIWYDSRLKGIKGSAIESFSRDHQGCEVPLFFKTIDAKETIEREKIRSPFLRGYALFSDRKRPNSDSRVTLDRYGIAHKVIDSVHLYDQCIKEIINTHTHIYIYMPNSNYYSIQEMYRKDGKTIGVVSGFKNPRYSGRAYDYQNPGVFYLDALYIHPSCKGKEERAIIEHILQKVRAMNCYGILMPITATNLSQCALLQKGFAQASKQRLVLVPHSQHAFETVKKMKAQKIFCPIR